MKNYSISDAMSSEHLGCYAVSPIILGHRTGRSWWANYFTYWSFLLSVSLIILRYLCTPLLLFLYDVPSSTLLFKRVFVKLLKYCSYVQLLYFYDLLNLFLFKFFVFIFISIQQFYKMKYNSRRMNSG